jgi:4a-hydroxytetrahydrobiopterin dehydratase
MSAAGGGVERGSELSARKCAPCEGGVAPLSAAEAAVLRAQLHPDWEISPDAKSLKRALRFRDFYRTMSFVNALAHIANLEDHHPTSRWATTIAA